MINKIEKIKEELYKTNSFDLKISGEENGTFYASVKPNYLIVEPLNIEAERNLRKNKFHHLLISKNHIFGLFYFNQILKKANIDKLDLKYRTRLDNLLKSSEEGNTRLLVRIALPINEFAKLEYKHTPYNKDKDHDYKDDEIDTLCTELSKPFEPRTEIKKVSTTYNTFIILDNAKQSKNQALDRYRNNTTAFYSDIIINYILEHARLIEPENFKYPQETYEVKIQVKELFKLYPHRTFKLCLPVGVMLKYEKQPRPKAKQPEKPQKERLSKYDTAIFTFTNDFLSQYKEIILKEETNFKNPKMFLKIPMWFLLEALKNNNLTSRGFNFLLWILSSYRMSNPKIFHSVKKILIETGADLTHGKKKPLATLSSYFTYLIKCKMLDEVESPLNLAIDDLDEPPKRIAIIGSSERKDLFITLKKPQKPKPEEK